MSSRFKKTKVWRGNLAAITWLVCGQHGNWIQVLFESSALGLNHPTMFYWDESGYRGQAGDQGFLVSAVIHQVSYWSLLLVAKIHCASSCKKGFIVKNQGCFMAPQKKMKWQPTPVFLCGESHGQTGLVGTVHGVAGSWTRLSNFHLPSLQKKMNYQIFWRL